MSVSWAGLAPFIAVLITLVAMQAAVGLVGAMRRRDYRLFEDRSKEGFAWQFPIPTMGRSPAEERRKAFSLLVDKAHKGANAAQTAYHNAVGRSAGCLVAAFIALVLGALPQQDWPVLGGRLPNHLLLEHVLTWLDAVAILFVLILFLYARSASRRWIASRVGTELLRQYEFLKVTFPCVGAAPHADAVKSQFDQEAGAIRRRVQEGPTAEIIARIQQFWSERKTSTEKRITLAEVPADGLPVYLQRRALRQLGWFADSKARLEHLANRRATVLVTLYVIAAGLAILKLAFFFYSGHSSYYLLAPLLIVTGMSAAMTAYYINQNARSLIHRYNTQQRRIAEWLREFNDRWNFAELPSLTLDAAAKNEIFARILQFEDLMIEELIDWVHITSHDAIELAP